MVGSELAGYHVEALIGRGGMGAVYRAEELTLGRKVALKVIAPELAQDSRFRERFLRESRMAASLDHPHIVPIFKAGEEDGALFLAMRYVEGTDLGKLLAEGDALAPARAIALLEQVADGLDAAHEKGLVHRDVKPSNVLVSRAAGKEHAYLADFGLTKRTGSLSGLSVAGEVVGTIEYVAPEQITDDEVGPPADLYSLGCVLYECLTAQSPFPRATDVALLWAHVHEDAPPPSEPPPRAPAGDRRRPRPRARQGPRAPLLERGRARLRRPLRTRLDRDRACAPHPAPARARRRRRCRPRRRRAARLPAHPRLGRRPLWGLPERGRGHRPEDQRARRGRPGRIRAGGDRRRRRRRLGREHQRRVGLPPRSGLTHSHRHHPRRGLPERHRCRERVGLGGVRKRPTAPHRPEAGQRGRAADERGRRRPR